VLANLKLEKQAKELESVVKERDLAFEKFKEE